MNVFALVPPVNVAASIFARVTLAPPETVNAVSDNVKSALFDEIKVSVPPAPSKLPPPVHPVTVKLLALPPPVRFAFSTLVRVSVVPPETAS